VNAVNPITIAAIDNALDGNTRATSTATRKIPALNY
jgi:hypothetical protein